MVISVLEVHCQLTGRLIMGLRTLNVLLVGKSSWLKRYIENQSANAFVNCSAEFCNARDLKSHMYSYNTCKKCTFCGSNISIII